MFVGDGIAIIVAREEVCGKKGGKKKKTRLSLTGTQIFDMNKDGRLGTMTGIRESTANCIGERHGNLEITAIVEATSKKVYVQVRCWCPDHEGSLLPTAKELFVIRGGKKLGCNKSTTEEEIGLRAYWHQHKSNAKRYGHLPAIDSYKEFVRVATARCEYCGADPSERRTGIKNDRTRKYAYLYRANSVDRIDRRKGYEPGNYWTLCNNCNLLKGLIENAIFHPGGYMGSDFSDLEIRHRLEFFYKVIDIYAQLLLKKDQPGQP